MTSKEIDQIIEESRILRLDQLGARLLSGLDRSSESLQKLRWELEEDLNESLYVSLDLFGWNQELMLPDMKSLEGDLAYLLSWFEAREEYECCAIVREAQAWLPTRIQFFLDQIQAGESPENLIGL
jgi:hypothetical protein